MGTQGDAVATGGRITMTEPSTSPESNKILRSAIWVAIGAMIAAALVCVIWVLLGDANGIVGKAFLTILLLAGFAGVSIFEANAAARRPVWLALASMITWVAALLIGAFLIWMPEQFDYFGFDRFFKFVLVVLILQGALLHVRLYLKSHQRYATTFTSVVSYVTMGLVVILAVMLILPIMTSEFVDYRSLYWRVVVALAILAAVGTALVPLVNALFAPRRPRPSAPAGYPLPSPAQPATAAPAAYTAPQWPTYADGVTPLPVLPDGSPDWNAYYTGFPSFPQQPAAAQPAAPTASQTSSQPAPTPATPGSPESPHPSGYQGYPPPPPLPGRQ